MPNLARRGSWRLTLQMYSKPRMLKNHESISRQRFAPFVLRPSFRSRSNGLWPAYFPTKPNFDERLSDGGRHYAAVPADSRQKPAKTPEHHLDGGCSPK